MLKWYMNRYSILFDFFSDLRVLISLRENSDPAETLKKIRDRLEQTTKELNDDKENS